MDRQITQMEGQNTKQFNETIAATKNIVKFTCLLKCKFLLHSK